MYSKIMLLFLVLNLYAAVAQENPPPVFPANTSTNLNANAREIFSLTTVNVAPGTTAVPATSSPPSPKLFFILNVNRRLPIVPFTIRQGILYSGDFSASTGTVRNVSPVFTGSHPSTFWALASDYRRRRVYYSNFRRNYFGSYNVETKQHTRLFQGLSFGIEGISVDWLSGTIYWIDVELQKIVVADASLKYFNHLIDIDSVVPARIAVHPLRNALFWTEKGTNISRMYRSDLSGQNRTLLRVYRGPIRIDALTIDVNENKLYWSLREQTRTGLLVTVNSILLDNPERISVDYRTSSGPIYGVASSGDYLYISDLRNRSVISFSKTSHEVKNFGSFRSTVSPYAMTIFSAESQPATVEDHEAHPCFEHTCEQICLTDGLNQHRCACQIGSKLLADGRSCGNEILTENFVLVLDDKHSKIYQVSLDDQNDFVVLPISNLRTPFSIDYDYEIKKIYWYDLDERNVYRSYLNGTDKEVFLKDVRATFITIEPASRNLYIVNTAIDSIEVASLDLPDIVTTLQVHDIHSAWQMVISHELGRIYWSDWGQSTADGTSLGLIESSNIDGSDRTVIVGNTQSPRALTIDEESQILYWTELGTSKIGWYNLRNNLTGEATLDISSFPSISKRLNGLEFYQGSLYISDLNRPSIFRVLAADVLTASDHPISVSLFGPSFYNVNGIKVVRDSAPSGAGGSRCARNRNNCPEVCLAKQNGNTECVCRPHSVYTTENNSCTAVHVTDDETPPSFGNTCPNNRILLFLRPDECSTFAFYNFTEPVATDDSGRAPIVKRSFNKPPPYNLSRGTYVFTYTATDLSGNVDFCRVNVIVGAPITCSEDSISPPLDGRLSAPSCGSYLGSKIDAYCFESEQPTFTLIVRSLVFSKRFYAENITFEWSCKIAVYVKYTCTRRGIWQSDEPPVCLPPIIPQTTPSQSSSAGPRSTVADKTLNPTSNLMISRTHKALRSTRASITSLYTTLASNLAVSGERNLASRRAGLSSGGIAGIIIALIIIVSVATLFLIRKYRHSWLSGTIFWQRKDDHVQLTEDFDQSNNKSNIYNF